MHPLQCPLVTQHKEKRNRIHGIMQKCRTIQFALVKHFQKGNETTLEIPNVFWPLCCRECRHLGLNILKECWILGKFGFRSELHRLELFPICNTKTVSPPCLKMVSGALKRDTQMVWESFCPIQSDFTYLSQSLSKQACLQNNTQSLACTDICFLVRNSVIFPCALGIQRDVKLERKKKKKGHLITFYKPSKRKALHIWTKSEIVSLGSPYPFFIPFTLF